MCLNTVQTVPNIYSSTYKIMGQNSKLTKLEIWCCRPHLASFNSHTMFSDLMCISITGALKFGHFSGSKFITPWKVSQVVVLFLFLYLWPRLCTCFKSSYVLGPTKYQISVSNTDKKNGLYMSGICWNNMWLASHCIFMIC